MIHIKNNVELSHKMVHLSFTSNRYSWKIESKYHFDEPTQVFVYQNKQFSDLIANYMIKLFP